MRGGVEQTLWINAVPFWFMWSIHDARYLRKDEFTDMVKVSYSRQNNVSVVRISRLGSRSELRLLGIIAMKAIKNIDREGNLHTCYGSEYAFSNAMSSRKCP